MRIEKFSRQLKTNDCEGLTFEQIAQAMNKDEVWVAALFYGQVSGTLLISSFVGALYSIVQYVSS
jgi:cyanate lyase